MDLINVVVGNAFDTLIQNRAGYYLPGTLDVVIQQGEGVTIRGRRAALVAGMTHVLPHEFAHATLATVYERSESALDARWSNEALTEVIAQKWYDVTIGP